MRHGTCLRAITGPCESMRRKDSSRASISGWTSRWRIAWPSLEMAAFASKAKALSISRTRSGCSRVIFFRMRQRFLLLSAKSRSGCGASNASMKRYFTEHGFYEKEIARCTEQFGHIAHVWSTYESRHNADDPTPFMRGINSIQLFYDGARWWIVTIYWQQESTEHPVPEKYL